jgi:hypothetical protein
LEQLRKFDHQTLHQQLADSGVCYGDLFSDTELADILHTHLARRADERAYERRRDLALPPDEMFVSTFSWLV